MPRSQATPAPIVPRDSPTLSQPACPCWSCVETATERGDLSKGAGSARNRATASCGRRGGIANVSTVSEPYPSMNRLDLSPQESEDDLTDKRRVIAGKCL